MMMMTPPIVGVPVFFIWPSSARSRIISPTCIICSRSIILRPNITAINSDSNQRASAAEGYVVHQARTRHAEIVKPLEKIVYHCVYRRGGL